MFNFTNQTIKTRGKYNFNVRDNNGLTADILKEATPALFANEAHESRSARYVYIPTIEIIAQMIKEGFIPVQAMQAKPRQEDKFDFAKHLVRFRKRDELGLSVPESSEIILVNSHDGSSSYHLMNGIFRTVCQNGLISGDIEHNFKVRHTGDIINDVIEAAYTVTYLADETMDTINEMKNISLIPAEQKLFAEYAMKARYNLLEDEEDEILQEMTQEKELPIPSEKLLRIRRSADNKPDLFTTMNVIQENVIKGGVSAYDKNYRKKTLREIKGIDQSVKVNKLIWAFAEELKKIHVA